MSLRPTAALARPPGALVCALALVACGLPAAPAVPPAPKVAPAPRAALAAPSPLRAHLEGDTPLPDDLRELCDRIGGRITGSPAAERATRWALDKFRSLGLAADAEGFAMPFRWLPERIEVAAIAPEAFPIAATAAPATPSTRGPLRGAVVDVGAGGDEDFARLGVRVAGALALVHTRERETLDDLFDEARRNLEVVRAATRAGAAGVLVQSSRPRGLLYQLPMAFGRTPAPLPVALVAREDAARLARLARTAEVRVRLDVQNRLGEAFTANNVVAELRGAERPDEIVLLGAHLDSWGLGTGAEDNGVNVALVLDVARAFSKLGLRPRRTVRFALFAGEEQGQWGSAGYVERHQGELGRHAAAVFFDLGSGRTRGFLLNGRPELRAPVADALAGFGLPASAHPIEATSGTDNLAFLLSGVPNLVADQDPTAYLRDYHASSDVVDRVDLAEARRNAALAAELLWHLADAREPPARQQSRAEVDRLLREHKLVAELQAFDQWDDWIAGRLGAPGPDR